MTQRRFLSVAEFRRSREKRLFRTIRRKTKQLTRTSLPRVNAYAMIQRRATTAPAR
jgi:hypothetical protein